MRSKASLVVMVAALLSTATVVLWVSRHHQAKQPSQPAITAVAPAKPKAAQLPLDPLTIAAIRARSYPVSAITLVQNLDKVSGYSRQIISYQSDGFVVHALLATPDGTAPAGGWPIIIFNHGYIVPSQYSTINSYATWVGALARGGFMVVKPDYRGNGISQGQPEGGHFSPVYAYDVLNLVASVKNIPGANSTRIGMFGHSMGGHETLRAIVSSSQIKASVIAAGVVGSFYDIFYNWPNSPAPHDQPLGLVQGKRQALIDKYGDPKSNPGFWDSASAVNYIASVTGSVQVDVGTADKVVPPSFSDHLVGALRQAGRSVESYTYPGSDHNFSSGFNLLMQRSVAFYRARL